MEATCTETLAPELRELLLRGGALTLFLGVILVGAVVCAKLWISTRLARVSESLKEEIDKSIELVKILVPLAAKSKEVAAASNVDEHNKLVIRFGSGNEKAQKRREWKLAYALLRGVIGDATFMNVGLVLIWIGAFVFAGGVCAGYWRSVLIELAAGAALFQGFRAFVAHRIGARVLVALVGSGFVVTAAAYFATDYWQNIGVEVGGGLVLFAALEKAYSTALLAAKRSDEEAKDLLGGVTRFIVSHPEMWPR